MNKNPNFDFYSFNLSPEQPQEKPIEEEKLQEPQEKQPPRQTHTDNRGWNPNGSPYGRPTEPPHDEMSRNETSRNETPRNETPRKEQPRNEYGNGGMNVNQPYQNPYQQNPYQQNPYQNQNQYQPPVPARLEPTEEERQNIRAARRAYSRTGWGFSAMIGAWYMSAELIVLLLTVLPLPTLLSDLLDYFSGSVTLYAVGIPVLLLVTLGVKREMPKSQSFGFKAFMFALLAAFTAMIAGSMIGSEIDSILQSIFGGSSDIVEEMMSDVPLWASAILTVGCAPVFEELIFRRILIPRLLPYGEGMAIFMSALLFGLMHGNFQQFFYATLVGLVLGYVFVRSGKWWLCMIMHAIFNFIGGIVPTLIQMLVSPELMDAMMSLTFENVEDFETIGTLAMESLPGLILLLVYDLVLYGAAITGLVLLIKNRRKLHLEPTSCPLPRGYKKGPAFGNPGIIFSLCLCGVLFVLTTIAMYAI